MLKMLFETGHPWITFKDTCNVRSPRSYRCNSQFQSCTEITLNTGADETAVCNLGSVVLDSHLKKMVHWITINFAIPYGLQFEH